MNHTRAVFLLFLLNLVDALVTLIWVTSDLAPEANHLMAALLDWGVFPFLLVKVGMGAFTAAVLLYGSEYKLARVGVTVALVTYIGVMGSHVLTGLAVFG
ncbi:MAG TPA: DUF5658 family protein [Pyrinomonadaceae bacterium]